MLRCACNVLQYRDVIGFNKDNRFYAGVVTYIAKLRYPTNSHRPFEWHITIRLANGDSVSHVFHPREQITLISMDDDANPARTRNSKTNWDALGISESDLSACRATRYYTGLKYPEGAMPE